eukprot:TRINITY_DN6782_c0_g1_i2.p1 TRINITY_DN6782_c0_g1~~TRINITY_DN6782_c0_g1_i2.p1  ORF type:complete len:404 (+),score=25.11 TRINITY_DN6782_c0_g1_i2:92-1303(+)
MGCSGCKAAERPEEEIAPRVGGRRRRRSNYRHDTSLGDSAQGAPLGSGASPPAQRPPHAAGAAPAAGPAGPSPVPPEPAELVHAFREACLRRRRGLLPKPLPAFASPSSYPQEPTGHVPARYASADEAFYGVIAKAQNVYCGELAELLRELRRACNPEQQARRVEQAELQLGRSLPRPCPLAPAEAAAEAAAATKRDLELDDLLDEVEMLQCFFRDSAPVPQPVPGWCASSEQASLALLPPQPPGDSRRAAAGAGLLRAGMRLLRGGRRRVPASAPQPQQPPTRGAPRHGRTVRVPGHPAARKAAGVRLFKGPRARCCRALQFGGLVRVRRPAARPQAAAPPQRTTGTTGAVNEKARLLPGCVSPPPRCRVFTSAAGAHSFQGALAAPTHRHRAWLLLRASRS